MTNDLVYTQDQLRAAWGPACKHLAHGNETVAWKLLDGIMQAYGYAPKAGETYAANCRPVTGGADYSLHAYFGDATWETWTGVKVQEAAATDFNSSSNPYGKTLHTDMPRAMVDAILAIRTNNGRQVFHWGGYFTGNKDAMHFEFGCTPEDLATGINMATVYGHPSNPDTPVPVPPSNGDEDVKHTFYKVSVDPGNSQTAPGDQNIWVTTDDITTHVLSGPALEHGRNLKWFDDSQIIFIPDGIHEWLVGNTRGQNTGP